MATDEVLGKISFDSNGLVPAVAQQHDSIEILMMAWMNAEPIRETPETGRVCYLSRSRQSLWRKGGSSGQIQSLQELRVDCDGDTLLLQVDQSGVDCHTGRRSCIFRAVRNNEVVTIAEQLVDPADLYSK